MFALKQLVASARSSSVALLGRAPAATKWRTTERLYNRGADCLVVGEPNLKTMPHSFYVRRPAGSSSQETLHFPANIQKIKETAESVCLFVDMGPLTHWVPHESTSLRASYDKKVNALSIAGLSYGGMIDKSYSSRLFLPGDCDVYKKFEMEKLDGGLMLTIGKRLVASSSSSSSSSSVAARVFSSIRFFFNGRHAWSVAKNYFADRYYPGMYMRWLNFVPHTFCYKTRVNGKRELLVKVSPGEGSKMVIDMPGIQKTSRTVDGAIQVHLDFKLLDFDDLMVQFKSAIGKNLSALFITGYMQKQDIRRHFRARVDFPQLNAEAYQLRNPKQEIIDGVLIVTIPRSLKTGPTDG